MRKIEPVVAKYSLKEQPTDFAYWQTKSVEERLAALEMLRQQFYNYSDETTPRLQRVYRITQQKQG